MFINVAVFAFKIRSRIGWMTRKEVKLMLSLQRLSVSFSLVVHYRHWGSAIFYADLRFLWYSYTIWKYAFFAAGIRPMWYDKRQRGRRQNLAPNYILIHIFIWIWIDVHTSYIRSHKCFIDGTQRIRTISTNHWQRHMPTKCWYAVYFYCQRKNDETTDNFKHIAALAKSLASLLTTYDDFSTEYWSIRSPKANCEGLYMQFHLHTEMWSFRNSICQSTEAYQTAVVTS